MPSTTPPKQPPIRRNGLSYPRRALGPGAKPPVRRPGLVDPRSLGLVKPSTPKPAVWPKWVFGILLLATAVGLFIYLGPWNPLKKPPPPVVVVEPEPKVPDPRFLEEFKNALNLEDLLAARNYLKQRQDLQIDTETDRSEMNLLETKKQHQLSREYALAATRGDIEGMYQNQQTFSKFWPGAPILEDWKTQIEEFRQAAEQQKQIQELQLRFNRLQRAKQFHLAVQTLGEMSQLGWDVTQERAKLVKTIMLPGKVPMRLRWIPPGRFQMGSPRDEVGRKKDENQHEVTLSKGFWLGETEITQAQWKAVIGLLKPKFEGKKKPMENITLFDAHEFIDKLNKFKGHEKFRLPTEAEWEYACRAGTKTPFHTGQNLTTSQGNFDGNYPYNGHPKGIYRQGTLSAKSLSPNAWGLYDMHGNVWEWCSDRYGPYPTTPVTDPKGASSYRNSTMIIRGGGWGDYAEACRSANRFHLKATVRQNNLGFRVAMTD